MPPASCLFLAVQFFEVDSRQVLQRKRETLDAVLPAWRRDLRRPTFAEGAPAPLHLHPLPLTCDPQGEPAVIAAGRDLVNHPASLNCVCVCFAACACPCPCPCLQSTLGAA